MKNRKLILFLTLCFIHLVGIPFPGVTTVILANEKTSDPYVITAEIGKKYDDGTYQILAKGEFPYKSKEVWEVLKDPEQYPDYMPRVEVSESLGKSKGRERFYAKLKIPTPFPRIWVILSGKIEKRAKQISWKLLDGNMEKNEGTVKVRKKGKGSIVEYDMSVKMGGIVPNRVVAWGTKSFMPAVLQSIGDEVKRRKGLKKK